MKRNVEQECDRVLRRKHLQIATQHFFRMKTMTDCARKTLQLITSLSTWITGVSVIVALACFAPAFAQVVVFDGFGDADINNNGTPFESVDTNVGGTPPMGEPNTYVPGRLQDDNGDGPANAEITTVLDASDTGIRWVQMRGFTGAANAFAPGAGNSKPSLRIVDDSQGAMQETKADDLGVTAIGDGYAMSWESRGGGSSAAGFFDQTISLGPEVDDAVKVSFDFRIWRDAPNLNSNNFDNVPTQGELRFGLFQDTDNQLGTTNPFAGRQVDANGEPLADQTTQFVPAVWGQEEGRFEGSLTGQIGDGDDIGPHGDNGWTASVFMGDPVLPNGGGTRIREELQSDRILQGSDVHTIVQPEDTDPDPFAFDYDFITLDLESVYNIELALTRATETDPGDTIFASLNITDKATGETTSLGGPAPLEDHTSGGVPVPGTGGIQSDSWDYFALRNASSGAAEFDFILDNFMVEVLGSNASVCNPNTMGDIDGSGDVAFPDFLILSTNFGQQVADHTAGDLNCSGDVAFADFLILSANFGQTVSGAAAVPEPTGFALLMSTVLMCGGLRPRRGGGL